MNPHANIPMGATRPVAPNHVANARVESPSTDDCPTSATIKARAAKATAPNAIPIAVQRNSSVSKERILETRPKAPRVSAVPAKPIPVASGSSHRSRANAVSRADRNLPSAIAASRSPAP
jgi:hypothetical protein